MDLFTPRGWLGLSTRTWLSGLALWCFAMLAFGLYLQHVTGLEPCPMCIVQRYALLFVGALSALAALTRTVFWRGLLSALALVSAFFGAFVAARQSWLQWYPPENFSCGRDLYGMIETFPLKRVIPMVFKGSGDCTEVDWTWLGLSIANWSFLAFSAMALGLLALAWQQRRR